MKEKPIFVHVNLVARDWRKLADFYIAVFGCTPQYPERNLKGNWIDTATGLTDVRIQGIHLHLPGREEGPTLEIFQYNQSPESSPKEIHLPGFAHLAFQVDDVAAYLAMVLHHGGSTVGEITEKTIEKVGRITFVYCRDPEGNILELQKWSREDDYAS